MEKDRRCYVLLLFSDVNAHSDCNTEKMCVAHRTTNAYRWVFLHK